MSTLGPENADRHGFHGMVGQFGTRGSRQGYMKFNGETESCDDTKTDQG